MSVYVGQLSPERGEDGAEALSDELGWVLAGGLCVKGLICLCFVVVWKLNICASLISWHQALRASILRTAHY